MRTESPGHFTGHHCHSPNSPAASPRACPVLEQELHCSSMYDNGSSNFSTGYAAGAATAAACCGLEQDQ